MKGLNMIETNDKQGNLSACGNPSGFEHDRDERL